MKKDLLSKLSEILEERINNSKTESEKVKDIELLIELKKETQKVSPELNDSIIWSLIKNIATHEAIEIIKDFLSG